MNLFFYLPTELIMGESCVAQNAARFKALGKRALIVAGKSAEINGALVDVTNALDSVGILHTRTNGAKPNPDLEDVQRIVDAGNHFNADFIVAIGGGSPIDAAKTAAALMKSGMNAAELLTKPLPDAAIPLVAVPTTAGTGTEANSYSILTLDNPKRKLSFSVPPMAPRLGLLDVRYTMSLDPTQSACTAVDALAHLVEGYIRDGWTNIGEMLALHGLRHIARCKAALLKSKYSKQVREDLFYASMIGGVTLAHAKTLAPHSMGYSLTVHRDMPHGQACGVLLCAYMRYMQPNCWDRVQNVLNALGMGDVNELDDFLRAVLPPAGTFTRNELQVFVQEAEAPTLAKPNAVKMDREMILAIYEQSLMRD